MGSPNASRRGVLPEGARHILWRKVWDKLLAAPPDASPAGDPGRGGKSGDPLLGPGAERAA